MDKIKDTNYNVDSLGNIFGLNGNMLKPAKDKKGYLRVGLVILKKQTTKKVHRLVAEAFILNPENKPCVNHKNGIKTDNRVENLEWVTYKENTIHAIKNNLFHFATSEDAKNKILKRGSLNGMSKLKEYQVIEIRSKFKPRKYTRLMLSKEYNVKESCIKDIVNKKSWKHLL